MTAKLVKRLRDTVEMYDEMVPGKLLTEAADRLDELERELADANETIRILRETIKRDREGQT